jgi:hypothetical protein
MKESNYDIEMAKNAGKNLSTVKDGLPDDPSKWEKVSIEVYRKDYEYLSKLSERSGAHIPGLISQLVRKFKIDFER